MSALDAAEAAPSTASMCSAKGHVRSTPKANICSALANIRFGLKTDMTSNPNLVGVSTAVLTCK